ncbi:hypothetical protein F4778DRAFT_740413 [Xylariomycetidae sp. FL2044]|nr:hypothetical protein F4778DRAFT_740413 [Xylariomycetidae sp. FL2044]
MRIILASACLLAITCHGGDHGVTSALLALVALLTAQFAVLAPSVGGWGVSACAWDGGSRDMPGPGAFRSGRLVGWKVIIASNPSLDAYSEAKQAVGRIASQLDRRIIRTGQREEKTTGA